MIVFHIFCLVALPASVLSRWLREMAAEIVARIICWLFGHIPLTLTFFSYGACWMQRKSSWISILHHLLPFVSFFIWHHHKCPHQVHICFRLPLDWLRSPCFSSPAPVLTQGPSLLPSIPKWNSTHESTLTLLMEPLGAHGSVCLYYTFLSMAYWQLQLNRRYQNHSECLIKICALPRPTKDFLS